LGGGKKGGREKKAQMKNRRGERYEEDKNEGEGGEKNGKGEGRKIRR